MKSSKSSASIKSFKDLKTLIADRPLQLSPAPAETAPKPSQPDPEPPTEHQLFQNAMADVTPLSHNKGKGRVDKGLPELNLESTHDNEAEALERLKKLVHEGEGFVVADTPEYMEGTGYQVNPEVTKQLHRGDYAIQAHIDLHGLNVPAAREAFDQFLEHAVKTRKHGVLVVHGRGLSSPAKPVLKTKVREWLTSGTWRKWVIAFSSARTCDGGAGATYVLLRQRPVTKRHKRRPAATFHRQR